MESKKIITVVGARPQFIKAAVISRLINERYNYITEIMVHTGQHFDQNMSDIFFSELDITKPSYFLNINNTSHGEMIGRMIIELEKIFIKENPACVLVYGDTNSTLAGGIAAKKLNIPIAHIEAGVRNFDEKMPEESNRYLVDRLSDINFCCTDKSFNNLISEGFGAKEMNKKFFNSGDLMHDAAIFESSKEKDVSAVCNQILQNNNNFILVTIHRASNTDDLDNLSAIIHDLNSIHKKNNIVMLTHPRTKDKIESFKLKPKFKLYEPLGHFDTLKLLRSSTSIITDSGGLVREAYFFDKKSVFVLSNPVWPELIQAGVCLNVEPVRNKIVDAHLQIENNESRWPVGIFGDGKAGQKILRELVKFLN